MRENTSPIKIILKWRGVIYLSRFNKTDWACTECKRYMLNEIIDDIGNKISDTLMCKGCGSEFKIKQDFNNNLRDILVKI